MNKIIFLIINYRIRKLNKKSLNTNLNGPKKIAKKKTLTSLGDGDFYNDKLNRNKQPHQ